MSLQIKSPELKTKILMYWRFVRNYNIVSTETKTVKREIADVLVSNGKEIIEVEIKCTKADLKADFKKKKHSVYENPRTHYCPNKFYFGVPKKLIKLAKKLTKDTPYGIIQVYKRDLFTRQRKPFCKIIKKASKMKPRYCEKLERRIIMRATSELVNLRRKNTLKLHANKTNSD